MRPRIEYRPVKLRTNEGPPHTDHWEAFYTDSAGEELYHETHPEYVELALFELHQRLRQEGYHSEDLPKAHMLSPRYVG
jgi:hypothetical protein